MESMDELRDRAKRRSSFMFFYLRHSSLCVVTQLLQWGVRAYRSPRGCRKLGLSGTTNRSRSFLSVSVITSYVHFYLLAVQDFFLSFFW